MQHKAEHRLEPWNSEQPRNAKVATAEALFAPPPPAKSRHALESSGSKIGSILVLLAISSVAVLGVFMPDEEKPTATSAKATGGTMQPGQVGQGMVPQEINVPDNAEKEAYALAYELSKQRVTTVGGLTRQERLDALRAAVAQVLGSDISQLDSAAIARLAKKAPESVKKAALRGVVNGEARGISTQSQLVVDRLLTRENHAP